jgi:hypothetical protein
LLHAILVIDLITPGRLVTKSFHYESMDACRPSLSQDAECHGLIAIAVGEWPKPASSYWTRHRATPPNARHFDQAV